ncbi:MAG: HlyD family type I secretion periplasmic adaptor subunit [Desulfobacterales bacterium]|nr:HlyD family type I secretion periplasmic adaptor subunit [Desulfobacterales bacterium]
MKQPDSLTKKSPGHDSPANRVKATTHLFWAMCVGLCLLFFAWAWFGKLDIVSQANGRVVPSSKIKHIQHLEGGIVEKILVREGAAVTAGQPLVILERVSSNASVQELQSRIAGLETDIARLDGLATGHDQPQFPEQLARNHPELVSQARELFTAQFQKYQSGQAAQRELLTQRRQDIIEIETRIRNSRRDLEFLEKQIAISAALLKDDLTTEYKHLGFLREKSKLTSRIEENETALIRARSALEGAEDKLKRLEHSFQQEIKQELKENRQELGEFLQRLKKFTNSLQRTTIRSPVDGLIKSLYIVTVGGVIGPGKTIMDIVPTGDRLVIEAHLRIQDIGFVRKGQKVVVKLPSRDARRYGKLDGTVIHISPDAFVTSQGQTFYTVRIRTEKNYFEWEGHRYDLVPGMMVTTYIHTGRRTVLAYMLDPLFTSMGYALQER